MQTYTFTGWVVRINRKNQYGPEFVVRNDESERDIKYPQHILFSVSKKKADIIPEDLGIDDKIDVKFVPMLTEGVSERTNRAYAINKNYAVDVTVVEKSGTVIEEQVDDAEDIPF